MPPTSKIKPVSVMETTFHLQVLPLHYTQWQSVFASPDLGTVTEMLRVAKPQWQQLPPPHLPGLRIVERTTITTTLDREITVKD